MEHSKEMAFGFHKNPLLFIFHQPVLFDDELYCNITVLSLSSELRRTQFSDIYFDNFISMSNTRTAFNICNLMSSYTT